MNLLRKAASVRNILVCVLAVLSVIILYYTVGLTVAAYLKRENAFIAAWSNKSADLILTASTSLMAEREAIAMALQSKASGQAMQDGMQTDLEKHRRTVRDAIDRLSERKAEEHATKGQGALLDAVRQTHAALDNQRRRVDDALAVRDARIDPRLYRQWAQSAGTLIEALANYGAAIAFRADKRLDMAHPFAWIQANASVKRAAWSIENFAAIEHTEVARKLTSGEPFTQADLQLLSECRGRILAGWTTLRDYALHPDADSGLVAAIDRAQKSYLGSFDDMRRDIVAAGLAGSAYPVSTAEWRAQSMVTSRAVQNLAELASEISTRLADRAVARGTRNINLDILLLIIGVGGCAISFWVVLMRVTRPLARISAIMGRLADGDDSIDVPWLKRVDEIGAIAKALAVFKNNTVERDRIRSEQARAKQQTEDEKRKAVLALADRFEA
jgi:methyl-accepting chemotaxis protein